MRKSGQRLSDEKIIDAYTHAYNIAQAQGKDGRVPEMPAQRDLKTMARPGENISVGWVDHSRNDQPSQTF